MSDSLFNNNDYYSNLAIIAHENTRATLILMRLSDADLEAGDHTKFLKFEPTEALFDATPDGSTLYAVATEGMICEADLSLAVCVADAISGLRDMIAQWDVDIDERPGEIKPQFVERFERACNELRAEGSTVVHYENGTPDENDSEAGCWYSSEDVAIHVFPVIVTR